MYPAIKHGDKVSYKAYGEEYKSVVWIAPTGQIILAPTSLDSKELAAGYQDNPQLMENGITNFRIHERADGTPVFMEGDVVGTSRSKGIVTAVLSDMFYIEYENGGGVKICKWMSFNDAHSGGWKLKDQEKEEKKSNEALSRLDLMKERGCGFLCSPTVCSSTCDNYPKEWELKDQEDTVKKKVLRFKDKGPLNFDGETEWVDEEDTVEEEKKGRELKDLTLDDIDNCKIIYTKQEIVDVLNHVMNNYTDSSEPAMHLLEVAEKLGITSEELE